LAVAALATAVQEVKMTSKNTLRYMVAVNRKKKTDALSVIHLLKLTLAGGLTVSPGKTATDRLAELHIKVYGSIKASGLSANSVFEIEAKTIKFVARIQ